MDQSRLLSFGEFVEKANLTSGVRCDFERLDLDSLHETAHRGKNTQSHEGAESKLYPELDSKAVDKGHRIQGK